MAVAASRLTMSITTVAFGNLEKEELFNEIVKPFNPV